MNLRTRSHNIVGFEISPAAGRSYVGGLVGVAVCQQRFFGPTGKFGARPRIPNAAACWGNHVRRLERLVLALGYEGAQ